MTPHQILLTARESAEPGVAATLPFRRSQFRARLPRHVLYTRSHYWLAPEPEPDLWRVGMTRFATRMLGEMVEMDFELDPGAPIAPGQIIGWLEGFKATTDIFAPLAGAWSAANPDLEADPSRLHADSHGRGWLYRATGTPEDTALDVEAYAMLLDATIDKMLGEGYGS